MPPCRRLRRVLLWIASAACLAASLPAQTRPQFVQPTLQPTQGRVTGFVTGLFQSNSALPDLLYLNAPTGTGVNTQVTAGLLLNKQGYTNLTENQIVFPQVSGVAAIAANFNADAFLDAAFALSPTVSGGPDVCVYFGTGATVASSSRSFGSSGCLAFPIQGSHLPVFSYLAALTFQPRGISQLLLEDTANNTLYVLANTGVAAANTTLTGLAVRAIYTIPAADGPGPILVGDFNNDGTQDFLLVNLTSHAATVYLGNGDGTFRPQPPTHFDHNVHSALLADLEGLGPAQPDLLVEADQGALEIFHNNLDGTFGPTPLGGTTTGTDGRTGNGGQLIAVSPANGLHPAQIFTATPIGISLLQAQSALSFSLKAIFNAGPGRSAFAFTDLNGDSAPDLAVDSPEGIAILNGLNDGSLSTSRAYAAGAPALNASVGKFRSPASNPAGILDVVTATSAANQGQLLLGDGTGAFTAASAPTTTQPPPAITPNLWSLVSAGDFDGDGNRDLAFTLTGLPISVSGPNISGLTLLYGRGDGTFSAPTGVYPSQLGAPGNNSFFGTSTVADLNADGRDDLLNAGPNFTDTLLGTASRVPPVQPGFMSVNSFPVSTLPLNQVATGSFVTFSGKRDLVLQNNADIVPYKSSGDGKTFTAMPKLTGTPNPSQLVPAAILLTDLDLDGYADVVIPYFNVAASLNNPPNPVSTTPTQLYVWYGNGDGTFGAPHILALGRNDFLVASADMNADGLPDLLLSDGSLVTVLYNQTNRSFGGEQHFLAGQGINSLSVADINNDGYPDVVVANGGASLANVLALGGAAPGTTAVTLPPNPDVSTGGITVLLNNALTRPVTGTVVAAHEPSQLGAGFTLTATLTPSPGVLNLPTGQVQFYIDGSPVGPLQPLSPAASNLNSVAFYAVPQGNTYTTGSHTLTAVYTGDNSNSPGTFNGTHAIQGLSATTTFLALCVGPTVACPSNGLILPTYLPALMMYYGQTFNGDASAANADPTNPAPLTGLINFIDNYNGVPSTLCQLGLAAGSSCPPAVGTTLGTSVGTNVFTAMYPGDATHAASTSPSVNITVLQDTNTATLSGTPNPTPQGQPVTFTATFTGNFAPPTGPVVFLLGNTTLGTATLLPNATGTTSTATFTTTTLPVGTDTITATYNVTQNFAAASATFTETITPLASSTTTLTSSLNPSTLGQSVTFTATVTPASSGIITFLDGTTTLLSVPVANGSATYTTAALTTGLHVITASYSGSPADAPSSGTLTQTVQAPGTQNFTLTVTPNPITAGVGLATVLQVTVSANNGFAQPVTLTCANLPPESTCTFANPTIPIGGATTTLILTTTAPHSCNSSTPYFTGAATPASTPLPRTLPALAALALLFLPGRRRWLRILVAVVAVAGALQLSGCATCTDLGTRPNTYTLQVTGTASTQIVTQPVTLKVIL